MARNNPTGAMITPADPRTRDCEWCTEYAEHAFQPAVKGAATFVYACGFHATLCEKAKMNEVEYGQFVHASKGVKRAKKGS